MKTALLLFTNGQSSATKDSIAHEVIAFTTSYSPLSLFHYLSNVQLDHTFEALLSAHLPALQHQCTAYSCRLVYSFQ